MRGQAARLAALLRHIGRSDVTEGATGLQLRPAQASPPIRADPRRAHITAHHAVLMTHDDIHNRDPPKQAHHASTHHQCIVCPAHVRIRPALSRSSFALTADVSCCWCTQRRPGIIRLGGTLTGRAHNPSAAASRATP